MQFCVLLIVCELLQPRLSDIFLSSLFLFLFWVSEGSHLFLGVIASLRSDTGLDDELEADRRLSPDAISTSLLDEFCGGDVEDETLPELEDNPGTTRGTKLSVLQIILFPSLVNRGF